MEGDRGSAQNSKYSAWNSHLKYLKASLLQILNHSPDMRHMGLARLHIITIQYIFFRTLPGIVHLPLPSFSRISHFAYLYTNNKVASISCLSHVWTVWKAKTVCFARTTLKWSKISALTYEQKFKKINPAAHLLNQIAEIVVTCCLCRKPDSNTSIVIVPKKSRVSLSPVYTTMGGLCANFSTRWSKHFPNS